MKNNAHAQASQEYPNIHREKHRTTSPLIARKIGYARVSTEEQNLHLQIDALKSFGCHQILTDQGVSGSAFSRPGLDEVMATLSPGDTLVVWRLDRLGRSLAKLIALVNELGRNEVEFVSVTEAINTNSSGGVFVFHLMAALAEFERNLVSERTRAGLAAAKARGSRLGRRPALTRQQCFVALQQIQTSPLADVAKEFQVHPRTLKRLIQAITSEPDNSDSLGTFHITQEFAK